jgi:hypothetical protein
MNKEGWIWKHVGQNEKKHERKLRKKRRRRSGKTQTGEKRFSLHDLHISDNFKRRKRQNY